MKTLVNPNQVFLRFPPEGGQPASLLRTLSAEEERAVQLFTEYYRDVIYPSGKAISSFATPFRAVLVNNRIDVSGWTYVGKGQLFNGLFTNMPEVRIYPALRRAVGLADKPSIKEKRILFRAIVAEYQKEHGPDELPGDAYFLKLNKERAFLPEAGLVVPTVAVFYQDIKSQLGVDSVKFREIYEFYFDIPAEISEEILQRNFPVYSLDDLKENFLNVYIWMHENNPELAEGISPGRSDVEQYAKECGGIPWSIYAYEFDPRRKGNEGNTVAEQRGIHWLRKECGFDPKPETADRNAHRIRIVAWNQESIFSQYVKAWVHLSDGKCNIERGIMVDPPRHKEMNALNVAQTSVINEMCRANPALAENRTPFHLDPGIVGTRNIFLEEIPSMTEIQQFYPGGPQGLLKDVEDLLCKPHGRRVGFSAEREAQLSNIVARHEQHDKDPLRAIDAVRERIAPRLRTSSSTTSTSTSTTPSASPAPPAPPTLPALVP